MSALTCTKMPKSTAENLIDSGDNLAPIVLKPSRRLLLTQALVLLAMGIAAPLALLPHWSSQPWWWLVLILLWALLGLAGYSIWMAHQRGPRCLRYHGGDWYLTLAGVEYRSELIGEAVIWPKLLVARYRLRVSGQKVNLVCLPDCVRKEDFRRLRVWLRIYLWHTR